MKIRNYMNFADPEFLTMVDTLLTKTNFNQHNLDIAREYLTSFDDKEELLTQVDKQDLNMVARVTAMGFSGTCLRLNMRCGILPMRRILQLLWAIGGSSAPALWGDWGSIHLHDDNNARWIAERLGEPAAAAPADGWVLRCLTLSIPRLWASVPQSRLSPWPAPATAPQA